METTWAILGLLGDYLRTDWELFWESRISRAACQKENNALNFELSVQNGKYVILKVKNIKHIARDIIKQKENRKG